MHQLVARMGDLEVEVNDLKGSLRVTESKASNSAREVLVMKREMIRISNESHDTHAKLKVMRESGSACKTVFGTAELVEMIFANVPPVHLMSSSNRINKMIKTTIQHSDTLQRILWKPSNRTGRILPNGPKPQNQSHMYSPLFYKMFNSKGDVGAHGVHLQGNLVYIAPTRDGALRIGLDLDTSRPVDYTQTFARTRYVSRDTATEFLPCPASMYITYEISAAEIKSKESAQLAAPSRTPRVPRWSNPLGTFPPHSIHSVRIWAIVHTTASTFGDLLRVAEEVRRGHPDDWPSIARMEAEGGWSGQKHGVWAPGGMGSVRGTDQGALDMMVDCPHYGVDAQQPAGSFLYRALPMKQYKKLAGSPL